MNELNIIKFPCKLDSYMLKKDGNVKFNFTTVVNPTDKDVLDFIEFENQPGHLLFSRNKIKSVDVPKEDVDDSETKSQSVQLRDALFVLYTLRGGNEDDKETWDKFYKIQMQAFKRRIIEANKKLEDK